jgi:pimeloyl-ACP methyl ester carboxylesterase
MPARHRRQGIVGAALLLLLCWSGKPVGAGEEAQVPLAPSAAKSDAFRCEDLLIASGNLKLAGTLYLPAAGPPPPAVVFVHGAGPQVRSDGFRELACHFARKGVAALIFDKRGCGASEGDWARASLRDLADDALACVRMLRARPDVNANQVGLWGLSQGASIIPLAAAGSPDVAFLIAVGGCLDFEEQMRYFRANLFRRRGLPKAVLDIANKADVIRMDFASKVRSGALPATQALRDRCRFEFDLDQAAIWRQVRQPTLAIYGELDRQVPVAESSARLAAAVEQAGNQAFTLVIYPGASHAIGQTRTGELGEEWIGYVLEYLEDMTDWVLRQDGAGEGSGRPLQRGRPPEAEQSFAAGHYDGLRWYGNAVAQAAQFLIFAVVFLAGAVAGAVGLVRGRGRDPISAGARQARGLVLAAGALSVLNGALLAGLVVVTSGLANPWEPHYPGVLNWLPLAGSFSVCLTLVFLVSLFIRWRALPGSRWRRICRALFAAAVLAFVPFLLYWNLLGMNWY